MTFYALICGTCVILLSMKLILINEETFILISFSLFFYYIIKNISPQITESVDNQISKMEVTIKSNFKGVKNDYLSLEEFGSSLLLKSQIRDLKKVVINNIKEIFKHKRFNLLSDTKNSYIVSLQVIESSESSIYKLIHVSSYVEVSKLVASKQYWLSNLKSESSTIRCKIENQELLNKI